MSVHLLSRTGWSDQYSEKFPEVSFGEHRATLDRERAEFSKHEDRTYKVVKPAFVWYCEKCDTRHETSQSGFLEVVMSRGSERPAGPDSPGMWRVSGAACFYANLKCPNSDHFETVVLDSWIPG
jgi:hypothetical protein